MPSDNVGLLLLRDGGMKKVNYHLKVDLGAPGTELTHFWRMCVGAGRANEGLRAGWQEQLKEVREHCGFQYCRFHGLFHDDMFVYREENGKVRYNFQYIDELFDRMLNIGVRPFVELGFCPSQLAMQKATVFWWGGHGSPPVDYAKWGDLVAALARHLVDRYGADEVRKWYFEVWNEPNLHPFFKGTKSQYFELYRVSAIALKRVDAALRLGGPATSNFVPDNRFAGETENFAEHETVLSADDLDKLDWKPVWLEEFLSYCSQHDLPVDFVSCHPYPTDWALDQDGQTVKKTRGSDATVKDLRLVRKMVDQSRFPNAEIHLTEWSSSPSPRDFTHDYPQAAVYIVKCNLESIGQVHSLSYWTFTDVFEENGAGDSAFHGGFGLLNFRGIPKPSFHAYRLLNTLGDELLTQVPGGVVTRHSKNGSIAALAYHYPAEERLSVPASFDTRVVAEATLSRGSVASLQIDLIGLPPEATILIETVDKDHGNAPAVWREMGGPHSPSREQIGLLKSAAWATQKQLVSASREGRASIAVQMQPWSLVSVRQI